MSLELKKAIEQISKDRGLDRDMLVSGARMAVKPGDVVYAEIIAPGNTYAWTNPIVVR